VVPRGVTYVNAVGILATAFCRTCKCQQAAGRVHVSSADLVVGLQAVVTLHWAVFAVQLTEMYGVGGLATCAA
jgi:hypothetical protein